MNNIPVQKKDCPTCGRAMYRGSPHDDEWIYQWECAGCGKIIGVKLLDEFLKECE